MTRRGFTLIELIIAMAVTAILATALTRMLVTDARFVSRHESLITARQTARAAMNVMTVELRLVSDSGLIAAAPESVTVRVPYVFGMACGDNAGATATVASLVPTDSLMSADAVPDGVARRQNDGTYEFTSPVTLAATVDPTPCDNEGIQTVPGGSLIEITPMTALSAGNIFYVYQTVTYSFMASTDLPGRIGLWRRVGTAASEELVAPFDTLARFRFMVGPDLQVQDAPPVDLTTVAGLELNLVAESFQTPQGQTEYQKFELPTQVFFVNRAN